MNVLEINSLTKKYSTGFGIENITFEVKEGSVLGVLGPNGSGKTTTLSCITGLLFANSGSFRWFDYEKNFFPSQEIGAFIEQPNFFPYMSAYDNLRVLAEIKNLKNIPSEIDRVLELTGLSDRKKSYYSTFSHGMKTRLAIAAVLMGDNRVLILDEPTNGLDPEGISFVRNLISEQHKNGKTIILASHLLDEVEKVCTDVVVLKEGKLLTSGNVNEILRNDIEIVKIQSTDNQKLKELLLSGKLAVSADIDGEFLIIGKSPQTTTLMISQAAVDAGILLQKIEEVKRSLEDAFLQIVKD